MLIKFSLRNYKAFREKAELSLIASKYDRDTLSQNITEEPKFNLHLLKSAVIYGANASGKSKLLEALLDIAVFVRDSSKESQIGDRVPVEPFWLNTVSAEEPTVFEVIFIHKDVLYRYGFEASPERVEAEWLYYKPNTKEVELFYRNGQTIDAHRTFNVGIIRELIKTKQVRDNALLLSYAAQFNNEQAGNVLEWFKTLKVLSGLRDERYQGYTMHKSKEPAFKKRILELLQLADLGIRDFAIQTLDPDELPDDMPESLQRFVNKQVKEKGKTFATVQTIHQQYDENRMPVDEVMFSMENDESSGTRKFFALTGPLLDVLDNGYTLVVDELDAKLHPNLVCSVIALFHSSASNPKNAQLIFNTHDTNLLSSGDFRRDQIWFTEKDRYGASTLYCLVDFKPRGEDNFERNYIRGKYGAIPYLGDFDSILHSTAIELTHEE